MFSIEADSRSVYVIVAGEEDLPPFEDLLSAIGERAGNVTIDMKVVPERNILGRTG